MSTIHVFNRSAICRRAHALAREARQETAQRAFDAEMIVVAGKVAYARPYKACLAATKLDLSSAMRQAWSEARGGQVQTKHSGALIVFRPNASLAPLRRLRFGRVWPLLAKAARWIESRFMPSRAA